MEMSIVICTLDRHDLLEKALRSCIEQESRKDIAYEVLVVDNSADANARGPVQALSRIRPGLVRYLSEPRTNIAHARNAGVAACEGRFIAFMDDDMTAPPGWIECALGAMEQTGADVLFGKVVPVFEAEGTLSLTQTARWFTRTFGIRDGATVKVERSGHVRHGRTSNCVLRRATTLRDPAPFDAAFGRTGGEDTDFLQRLGQQGAVMAFSERAWMSEFIPLSRSTPDYVSRREYRGSQNFVRSVVKNSPRKRLTACRHMATGIAQFAWAATVYGLGRVTGRDTLPARVAAAAALGKVLWMRQGASGPYR
jgi:succinoglycan biosynthesis protein ExoM